MYVWFVIWAVAAVETITHSSSSSLFSVTKIPYNDHLMIYSLRPQASSSRRLYTKLINTDDNSGILHNSIKETSNYILDVIYFMNSLVCQQADEYFLDDDHFCSKLCDRGFSVHIVTPLFKTQVEYSLSSETHSSVSSNTKVSIKSNDIDNIYSTYSADPLEIGDANYNNKIAEFPCNILRLVETLHVNPHSTAVVIQELAVPLFLHHITEV